MKLSSQLLFAALIALMASGSLLGMEAWLKPVALESFYFQEWSSETMMQTVSLQSLYQAPWETLWHLHIQPPAFDAIRATLAHLQTYSEPLVMLQKVDQNIYYLWAMLFGLSGALIFWWLSEMTRPWFALISSILFLAHPAAIFYASFLDTTFPSAFLILCLCYLLWRIKAKHGVPAPVLALAFLALFFTRSIFFWPWLPILTLCFLLLKYPLRQLGLFLLITGLVVGLYTAKQMYLFGLSSTSSFSGLSLSNSIGLHNGWDIYFRHPQPVQAEDTEIPDVLVKTHKSNGANNFNTLYYLAVNEQLRHSYTAVMAKIPPSSLLDIYNLNQKIFWLPSSQYSAHVIVDRLPQRGLYDTLFSAPVLPLLLAFALLFWLLRHRNAIPVEALGLFLPVALIITICIICDRGENLRFKFLVEPVLFVFLASQFYAAAQSLGRGMHFMQTNESL